MKITVCLVSLVNEASERIVQYKSTVANQARWYVVASILRKEDEAERNLARQGFTPFVPRLKKTVRHARRLTTKRTAFFPGYLFVAMDLHRDRWRAVNGTFGVRSLVMVGERPVPVPVGIVERLIEMTDASGLLDLQSGLAPGSEVKILTGPFAGLLGKLDRMDAESRVRVLIGIMNAQIPVSMDRRDIISAAA